MPLEGNSTNISTPPEPVASRIFLDAVPVQTPAASGEITWLPVTFRALRHRNYRLYFLGQLISLLGTLVQSAALTYLAFQMTDTSRWPALTTVAQFLPAFFLGPLGGALADRWPKRALIFWTQAVYLVLALLLAGLVLSGIATPWHLLLIALGNGLVTAIDLPARLAFVNDMVGREDLVNAVALNSLLFNAARALGPAIGGLLYGLVGPGMCFLLNGLSYFAVLAALAAMDGKTLAGPGKHGKGHSELRAILAAFGYLLSKPRLAFLVLLAGVLTLFGWPFMVLLPALAKRQMGVGEQGYGLLLSATGIGALAAALVVASFNDRERRRRFLMLGSGLTTLGLLGLSLAHSLHAGLLWCALLGFGLILFFPISQAVVQLGSNDQNRGRIMGIWSMVMCGALLVGSLLVGPASDLWSEAFVLRLTALGCALATLGVLFLTVLWRPPAEPRA